MGTHQQIDGVSVYRAEPAGSSRGTLIVIHEIWGLVEHITDVADRFAAEGYRVVAPDVLSDAGITPKAGAELMALMHDPDEAKRLAAQPVLREKFGTARDPEFARATVERLEKVVEGLVAEGAGPVGVVGFCFGGTYAFALAAADDRVAAAVPFYGQAPADEQIAAISCPVLAIYGGTDERLMADLPRVRAAARSAGVDLTDKVYPEAGHAFFNDTNAGSYVPAAAADAWRLTLDFLAEHLS